MVKLTLTYVDRKERTSAKTGKPFTSLSLKAVEYNDKFLSGFGNKDNANWKVGDVVEVAEVKEVSKDGKIYLNFEMPRKEDVKPKWVEEILGDNLRTRLEIREAIGQLITFLGAQKDDGYPSREKEIGLKEGEVHPWMKPEAPVSASMPATNDHTADPDMGPIDDNFGF